MKLTTVTYESTIETRVGTLEGGKAYALPANIVKGLVTEATASNSARPAIGELNLRADVAVFDCSILPYPKTVAVLITSTASRVIAVAQALNFVLSKHPEMKATVLCLYSDRWIFRDMPRTTVFEGIPTVDFLKSFEAVWVAGCPSRQGKDALMATTCLDVVGFKPDSPSEIELPLIISDEDKKNHAMDAHVDNVDGFDVLKEVILGEKQVVAIAPTSPCPSQELGVEVYEEVITRLAEKKDRVFVLLGGGKQFATYWTEMIEMHGLAGRCVGVQAGITTPRQLVMVLSECEHIVTSDEWVMQLGYAARKAAGKKPSMVYLCGPLTPAQVAGNLPGVLCLFSKVKCSGCDLPQGVGCPIKTPSPCLAHMSPSLICEQIEQYINH